MSLLLFIIILLVLIIVHEFGHFIVAKRSGIRVDEFGIGFPPRAWTWMRKNGTDYTLNWIPFGGFVKIFGENPDEESMNGPDAARSFVNKPKWVQALVLVAGVVMNMLLAWVLLAGVFFIGTDMALTPEQEADATDIRLVVSGVFEDSPAAELGIQPGDTIRALSAVGESLEVYRPHEASEFIAEHTDDVLKIEIERNDEIIEIAANTKAGLVPEDPERKILGVSMGVVGNLQYRNPIEALWEGGKFTLEMTRFVAVGLASFFAGLITFSADFTQVAGPIGIVGVVDEAASVGLTSILFLTALISINLAIINILPVPALDGGRLLFLLIEVIKGSPINPRVTNALHAVFFFALLALIVVVSFFDIGRLLG